MFTSRLPKSTSARRPSNPNDGSTSLFGSNIPVSVRKANLFTPQPKRSLQGGLNSTSRKSYLTTEKKYQRPSKPAPDRDEQIRMFDNLVEYIKVQEPNFPLPEAKRFFSSVSTTECSRIFEFLIGRLCPEFKINKLEIDVPEALALLQYPFIRAVTKSALVSITTRQAIVNLLVIFDWLVNVCKESDVDDNPIFNDDEDTPPLLETILSNPSEPIEDLNRVRDEQESDDEPLLERLKACVNDADRLAGICDEMEKLEAEQKAFFNDFQECDRYKAQINEYLLIRNEQERALEERHLQEQDDIMDLRKQLEELSPIVDVDQPACDAATLAHCMKHCERIKQDLENEKRSIGGLSCISDLRQDLELKKGKHREHLNKFKAAEKAEFNHVEAEKRYHDEILETNYKRLDEYLKTYGMEAQSVIREAEADRKRLIETSRRVKDNNKTVGTAARRLKRGLK